MNPRDWFLPDPAVLTRTECIIISVLLSLTIPGSLLSEPQQPNLVKEVACAFEYLVAISCVELAWGMHISI